MNNNQTFLTEKGLENLKKELQDLKDVKRPALVRRVAQARGFGDLMENTEYSNAREELAFIDGRIEELEQILINPKIIKKSCKHNGIVELGCKVKVKVKNELHEYIVVGEWEADPLQKKISHTSPLGKALLGKKAGDTIEIEAPAGKIVYEIKEIN